MRQKLRRCEGRDPELHVDQALVEEIARYAGRRDVLARWSDLQPARACIHGVERHIAALVDELDLGEDRRPAVAENGEADLDPNRMPNIDGRRFLAVLDDAGIAKPDEVVARGVVLGPALTGPRSVSRLEVVRDQLRAEAVLDDEPLLEPDRAIAELCDRLHVVRYEQHRPARRAELLHPAEAAPLELGVADREHLVDEEDLRLEMRGDREREPDVHAARVALHRRVDEPLDPGELDDVVEACA